jgi:hypothetical protein
VPTESHDKHVDIIITDKRIIYKYRDKGFRVGVQELIPWAVIVEALA